MVLTPPPSRRRTAVAGILLAGLSAVSMSGCQRAVDASADIAIVEGSSRYPSDSASDWVTYGDFALAVRITTETAGRATQEEIERGEGIIPREVEMKVEKILWTSPRATQEPPTTLRYEASGWIFRDGNSSEDASRAQPFAVADSPRLEVGHRYVLAVKWAEARCSQGDSRIPAQWVGLGGTGKIAFDDVGGVGEFEGQTQTLEQAEARARARPDGLSPLFADQAIGKDLEWVKQRLAEAVPEKAQDFENPAPC